MGEAGRYAIGRRAFVKGGLVASALAALAGCGRKFQKSDSAGEKGGVLNCALDASPACIDPYNAREAVGFLVVSCLFNSLTQYDFRTKQIKPCACARWEVNGRGDTFTFHLVKGAKFHNGEAVDAEAFKRGWERMINPKTGRAPSAVSYHLSSVQGYDAMLKGEASEVSGLTCPDKNTFVVKLSYPFTDFIYVVSHVSLAPVPKAALEDFDTFYKAPIGNGPFKMRGKWVDGEYIHLDRFDDYYGEKPAIDGVHFKIEKDMETSYREFQAGSIDVANIPPSVPLKELISTYGKSDDGYTITSHKQLLTGGAAGTYYILLNLKDPVLADVNVRRALSLAINREAICETLFYGGREPADDIVPPPIDGHQAGMWKYSHFDPGAAEKLLDVSYPKNASGKRDLKISLAYNFESGHEEIMSTVANDWEKLGITVELIAKERTSLLSMYQSGDFQTGRYRWFSDYPTMDNFLYPLFYTSSSDNSSRYSNPDVDALIIKARAETDKEKSTALLHEANALIGDDVPIIPVMYYAKKLVGSSKILSLYIDPQDRPDLIHAKLVKK